jgi:hypothetical protein
MIYNSFISSLRLMGTVVPLPYELALSFFSSTSVDSQESYLPNKDLYLVSNYDILSAFKAIPA